MSEKAYEIGRESERKAVVAWLRDEAEKTVPPDEASALRVAAWEIEAGEHLKDTP